MSAALRALWTARDRPTLVLMSQVYVPDPAAVGQYMHEVAAAMSDRDVRVIAITADRGYDDPAQRYTRYEQLDGVHVVRLPWSSFGKRSVPVRLIGGSAFTSQAAAIALGLARIDAVLISTSPPMCGLAGLAVSRARNVPLHDWVMDINPDQIVATGKLGPDAAAVRGFELLNRATLARASTVITLDRFMAARLAEKYPLASAPHVLPPWPLFEPLDAEPDAGAFRREHALGDARVIMYSGNLSIVHPVDTLLEAARRLQRDPRLQFVFVGGGLGRDVIARYVEQQRLSNVRLLPYQPRERLPVSLSAADVHVVAMGEAMVGIVHPSKIYSALAAGRPILALGPRRSHIAELVREHDLGWHIEHGDVEGAVATLSHVADTARDSLRPIGARARALIRARYDKSRLLDEFCTLLGSPGVVSSR
jgi:glycosyltransferase involved in cell wall biosynthesis